jgi:hypothetical protein
MQAARKLAKLLERALQVLANAIEHVRTLMPQPEARTIRAGCSHFG